MFLQFRDFLITPAWFILLILLALWIQNRFYPGHSEGRYWILLLSLKMISGILLGFLYMYYYGYGDTLRYYYTGSVLYEILLQDPQAALRLWLGSDHEVAPDMKETALLIPYWKHQASALFVGKISGCISLLTFNSYFANSLFFSFFSATGIWVLYRTLSFYLPENIKLLRISVLFLPSMIFWSSGLFKDPIAIGFMGWLLFAFHRIMEKKGSRILYVFIFIFSALLLFNIKVYILLAWLPFLIIWMVYGVSRKFVDPLVRRKFLKLASVCGLGLGVGLVQAITVYYPQFAIELLMDSIVSNRNELLYTEQYYESGYGSRFDIGNFDASWQGILSMIPSGLFAALFRPGLWDIRSLIMIPAALENTVILLWCFLWLTRGKISHLFAGLKGKPVLSLGFVFSLVFAIFVGLSTSNFGTMARYRLPAMPFFLAGLIALSAASKKNKPEVFNNVS